MSILSKLGVTLGVGSTSQRFQALEQAVMALDATVTTLAQAVVAAGIREGAAITAAQDAGLPDPPPLPTTVDK